jgi:hypothetical protein
VGVYLVRLFTECEPRDFFNLFSSVAYEKLPSALRRHVIGTTGVENNRVDLKIDPNPLFTQASLIPRLFKLYISKRSEISAAKC